MSDAQKKYAKDQPTGFNNHISKVAIVGAGGHLGVNFTEALLKTGKHTVTALTRADSTSKIPAGAQVVNINYDDEDSIVSALKGQDFLIITLGVRVPQILETHSKLVRAAGKAGVKYIMPSFFGSDFMHKPTENTSSAMCLKFQTEIESAGCSHITMVCGCWYEWSLAAGPSFYGFDFQNKAVTFYDEGTTYINSSTWKLCGAAVANLVSLKELPDDANDKSITLSHWKNKPLYISSFKITQKDMLASVHRVIGTQDKDWKISFEAAAERYKNGMEEMKNGNIQGVAKASYAKIFFPDTDGEFESRRELANSLLGLPKEDLDVATKRALEMVESGFSPYRQ